MANHATKKINKNHLLKKVKNVKNDKIILGAIILAVLIICVAIFFIFFSKRTTADITKFKIGNYFECTVDKDVVLHDDEVDADYLVVDFTAKNISDGSGDEYEETNTTGWDENTKTYDEVTPDELNNLSYEETERINEKTWNEFAKENSGKKAIDNYVVISATQNNMPLTEPMVTFEDGTILSQNLATMAGSAKPGESFNFSTKFYLQDESTCTMLINYQLDDEDNTSGSVEIHFNIFEHMNDVMRKKVEEKNAMIAEQQAAETITMKGVTIKLVDGWYADQQMTAVTKLKNRKFSNGGIDINFDSNVTPAELASQTAAWVTPSPTVEQKEIADHKYYYFERANGNGFVLTCVGKGGLSIKITSTGISLDEAMPLIESLDYN